MDLFRLADADAVLPRVKAGDPAAQEALYRAFEAPVYNLARRICRTTEDAEDVVQETFLEVYRSIGRYRGDGSLWGWVRTIASSKALMRLRRNKYRQTDELQDDVTPLRREDAALRIVGDLPRGGVAARRRGIHARRNRGHDGQDGELFEVAAGAGPHAAPPLAG